MMKRTSVLVFFFWLLVLEGLVALHRTNQSTSASLASVIGADLDYCDVEWFALETN